MDDQHAHFLFMLLDAYADARMAGLLIKVGLRDGSQITGVPSQPLLVHSCATEKGHLELAGQPFALADVCEYAVQLPQRPHLRPV